MAITTVYLLDIKSVRRMIAVALSLSDDMVIDASDEIDTHQYTHFITVQVVSQNELGSQVFYDGTHEQEILSSVSEITISVNAYGDDSYQLINKLISSMNATSIYQMQRKMKMGFLRASQIKNLLTRTSGGQEQHSQVDLIFSIKKIIKADVQRGESVQIKTEVN